MYVPSASLVLISGFIMMWFRWLGKEKPVWLLIKERFGVPIILLIIFLTIFGGKSWVQKALAKPTQSRPFINRYRGLLYVAVFAMVVLTYAGIRKPM